MRLSVLVAEWMGGWVVEMVEMVFFILVLALNRVGFCKTIFSLKILVVLVTGMVRWYGISL